MFITLLVAAGLYLNHVACMAHDKNNFWNLLSGFRVNANKQDR
jgi:hypothetical protein